MMRPDGGRCQAEFLREGPCEISRVFKSYFVGNFRDIQVGGGEQFFGPVQPVSADEFGGRMAGKRFQFSEQMDAADLKGL